MLNAIQGQVYSRQLDDNYDTVISNVAPSDKVGYLSVSEFAKTVISTLDNTRVTGVQSILLELNILPGIGAIDVLRLCQLKRHGDICTANETTLFLFLFACRESDVSIALDHVIELPIEELFIDHIRHMEKNDILHSIKQLTGEQQENINYSKQLADNGQTSILSSLKNTHIKNHNKTIVFKPNKPVTAMRQPLRLKNG